MYYHLKRIPRFRNSRGGWACRSGDDLLLKNFAEANITNADCPNDTNVPTLRCNYMDWTQNLLWFCRCTCDLRDKRMEYSAREPNCWRRVKLVGLEFRKYRWKYVVTTPVSLGFRGTTWCLRKPQKHIHHCDNARNELNAKQRTITSILTYVLTRSLRAYWKL